MKNTEKAEIEQIKQRKELFFKNGDPDITIEEWKKQDCPHLWFEMYNKNGIKIWEDRAYGNIKLITPKGDCIGKDIAIVEDIITFGPYYEGSVRINIPYAPI